MNILEVRIDTDSIITLLRLIVVKCEDFLGDWDPTPVQRELTIRIPLRFREKNKTGAAARLRSAQQVNTENVLKISSFSLY